MEAEWKDSLCQEPEIEKQWSIYTRCEVEKSTWEPTEKQKTKKLQTMVWAVQCGAAQRGESEAEQIIQISVVCGTTHPNVILPMSRLDYSILIHILGISKKAPQPVRARAHSK